MDFIPNEIDILFDAVEGYAPLCDAKWECSRQKSSRSDAEWIRQGQAAVSKLIKQGLILLFWNDWKNTPREIATEQAVELLQKAEHWFPIEAEASFTICFSATEKGKEVFNTSEDIRAYYGSEEFSSRYPFPEWHPMRRN